MQVALLLMLMVPGQAQWVGYGEYLNLDVRGSSWEFPLEEQVNSHRESLYFNPDRANGFRVGVGRQFADCWEATWNYTYFDTSESGENTTAGQFNTTGPAWAAGTTLYQHSSLNYNVHDIQFSRVLEGDTVDLRVFGGFRWAMIDSERGLKLANLALNETTNLNAYGLRIGAQMDWRIGSFSLFGRGAVSGLYGQFEDQYTRAGLSYQYVTDRNFTGAIPVVDVSLGGQWTNGTLSVAAGYEVSVWGNTIPDSFHQTNTTKDLVLDGFFAQVGLNW